MNAKIQQSTLISKSKIKISGSKSETNRLLLLQALYPELILQNTSTSDDSIVMTAALTTQNETIDIHHAGTAMRFLTAYFATVENKTVILTGSERMKQRPIKILVDALNQLGADIQYLENHGFPPIKINGKKLQNNQVSLDANISSQYISALLLIAPKLNNGLKIKLVGSVTSAPYIKMTLELLAQIGIQTQFENNQINLPFCQNISNIKPIIVESDWSSASYFYAIIALSPIGSQLELSSYKKHSLQGDSTLAALYEAFGVTTQFEKHHIILTKTQLHNIAPEGFIWDGTQSPDIAQTLAVTCFGLQIGCQLTGLHTLKIKETDRLEALQTELAKLGATINITQDSLQLMPADSINANISISTYNDHRMAMAFAPLALKTPLEIQDAGVVSKSYPDFWKDLQKIGFKISLNH